MFIHHSGRQVNKLEPSSTALENNNEHDKPKSTEKGIIHAIARHTYLVQLHCWNITTT